MGDLLKLAERVEAAWPATETERYALLMEAYGAVYPDDANPNGSRFAALASWRAYLDAADMLRPVEHNGEISTAGRPSSAEAHLFYTGTPSRGTQYAFAEGDHAMARAWLAVILRCHVAGGEHGG